MVTRVWATLLALLIALNSWGWQEYYLGLALGITWLLVTSWLIGGRAQGLAENKIERMVWGAAIAVTLISLVGTFLFYINLFNAYTISGLMALLPWLGKNNTAGKSAPQPETDIPNVSRLISWFSGLFYLSSLLIIWLLILGSATAEAIRTPWQVVTPLIFLLLAPASGLVLTIARQRLNIWWLIPFYLVFLGLLGLVYPLGYGFDPFIHQASEKLLAATGTISPKPLYYLGQYVLVTFLSRLLNLPLSVIDIWLVPTLASLLLPAISVPLARQFNASRPWPLTLALVPLIFALSIFTYTTPQGLAYLLVFTTFMIIGARKTGLVIPAWLPWLIGLAAVVSHPLAGLPAIGLLLAWWIKDYGRALKRQKLWYWLTGVGSALVVPISFALLSWLKPSAASIALTTDLLANLQRLGNDILFHLPFLPQFIDIPDAVYLWGRPLNLLFIVLAAVGWWLAKDRFVGLRWLAWAALWPAIGYLLLTILVTFPNLPPNEQNFYSVRLWDLTLLILWPLSLLGAYEILRRALQKIQRLASFFVVGSLLLVTSFYLTYPRFDIWHRDTAYNTTPYDLAAVRLVDQEADGAPYVVLANQAVAAAAVNEFGFSKYYGGHFYYPLPTGTNPLYQVYLNATERGLPMRDIVSRAATLGVPQVFLILNRYWADYDTLNQVAKKEADAWWEMADGRISVYRYDF